MFTLKTKQTPESDSAGRKYLENPITGSKMYEYSPGLIETKEERVLPLEPVGLAFIRGRPGMPEYRITPVQIEKSATLDELRSDLDNSVFSRGMKYCIKDWPDHYTREETEHFIQGFPLEYGTGWMNSVYDGFKFVVRVAYCWMSPSSCLKFEKRGYCDYRVYLYVGPRSYLAEQCLEKLDRVLHIFYGIQQDFNLQMMFWRPIGDIPVYVAGCNDVTHHIAAWRLQTGK